MYIRSQLNDAGWRYGKCSGGLWCFPARDQRL